MEVDVKWIGVYGYFMGGKLIVMVLVDEWVKVVVFLCGGISDWDNVSVLFCVMLGDGESLKCVVCFIIFFSLLNDFYGRIGDLLLVIEEICFEDWCVVCLFYYNY